jgi:hypothetical protein
MSEAANRIVQKLWSYCHVLRDEGLSYQDYLGTPEKGKSTAPQLVSADGSR